MKKSGQIKVAARYVSALFDAAKAAGAVSAVERDLGALAAAIAADASVLAFVSNPLLSVAEQETALIAVANAAGMDGMSKKFLAFLVRARRLFLLVEIARQFARKAQDDRGEMTAQVVTAVALTASQLQEIAAQLGARYRKTVHLESRQDPAVIGGMIVSIDGLQIDASIAGKLHRVEQSLKVA